MFGRPTWSGWENAGRFVITANSLCIMAVPKEASFFSLLDLSCLNQDCMTIELVNYKTPFSPQSVHCIRDAFTSPKTIVIEHHCPPNHKPWPHPANYVSGRVVTVDVNMAKLDLALGHLLTRFFRKDTL